MLSDFLSGEPLTDVSPEHEGGIIAGDIMDASIYEDQCAQCGREIVNDLVPCTGNACAPPIRLFHKKCIPAEANVDNYKCQICDPLSRQDNCQAVNCKQPYTASAFICTRGCQRYIHRNCIQGPLPKSWYCGVCSVTCY